MLETLTAIAGIGATILLAGVHQVEAKSLD